MKEGALPLADRLCPADRRQTARPLLAIYHKEGAYD
jgi:hypothetical protein